MLQLCFVVLCTSTSISIIGSEIIGRSHAPLPHHMRSSAASNLSRESLAPSSSSVSSSRRDCTAHNDSWSVERLFESHSDNEESYNRNLENSLQELNDLRNVYTTTTRGYQLCSYSRQEHWNSITRGRSSSSGGILQHHARTTTAAAARSPSPSSSYVMASRHYPHSESGWLVMWLSRSGGDPTYSIHDENQRISTV